ncbi:acylphosphatase [Candidatus Thorarchaeota archaeon]|nr:MAG: acylphosphatase [Candidatus Thorarchaeota archaeon]
MIISGKVQGVGFRATTRKIATELGLKGLVRNLRNGNVEVFCEGNKEKINELATRLRNLERTSLGVRPSVDSMNVAYEGEPGYSEAWKPYSGFNIDY